MSEVSDEQAFLDDLLDWCDDMDGYCESQMLALIREHDAEVRRSFAQGVLSETNKLYDRSVSVVLYTMRRLLADAAGLRVKR